MRTTDIQIWYKQAYWSQTKLNYKHGFSHTIDKENKQQIQVLYQISVPSTKTYISEFLSSFVFPFFFSLFLFNNFSVFSCTRRKALSALAIISLNRHTEKESLWNTDKHTQTHSDNITPTQTNTKCIHDPGVAAVACLSWRRTSRNYLLS